MLFDEVGEAEPVVRVAFGKECLCSLGIHAVETVETVGSVGDVAFAVDLRGQAEFLFDAAPWVVFSHVEDFAGCLA